jgi:disulfide bond formation protein DsbB
MNLTTIHYLNIFLGAGAIILQILAVVTLFILFFALPAQGDRGPKKNKFLDFIEKHFLVLGFLISLVSALFSLVYSEVIKFAPCQLCWYQRVFMFPQVFIFGVAVWHNFRNQLSEAKNVIKYSIPLLGIGFIISVYQNFIYYFGGSNSGPCDASGVSCFQHLVSEFGGYISIPMLSLTSFFVLLTITLVVHFYKKE